VVEDGKRIVREEFSKETMVERTLAVYQELMSGTRMI
jgi:hypothetical protein